jgi:hypothetical protein
MRINKFNPEGYLDPTPYLAFKNITARGYKPLVYVCSPYAGDTERNIVRARRYSRFAMTKGCIPIAPHLLFPQFMDDTDKDERDLGIFMGIVLLKKCAELWVFGSRISEGMAQEIAQAERRSMVIRYFNDRCQEGI